jgi:hypothetical protein
VAFTPEEHRLYMIEYRAKRRQFALAKLGGVCVICGTSELLEFDHIDPSTKIKSPMSLLHASWIKFNEELDKCQLLCKKHHQEKSKAEGSLTQGKASNHISHGTSYAYNIKKCRCELCKAAKSAGRSPKRDRIEADYAGFENW